MQFEPFNHLDESDPINKEINIIIDKINSSMKKLSVAFDFVEVSD